MPDLLPFVTVLTIDGGPRYALMVGLVEQLEI
jgi:hypothetical protein